MAVTALTRFTEWLTRYGDAWEASDADQMGSLFVVGATFQPGPFDELVRGRQAIVGYFAGLFGEWPNASFTAQVLGVGDTYGVAHWRVASSERAIDGILLAALDEHGRCSSLRTWWHATRAAGLH
ncbi:MAG TPA: nuclear transport factor 2 family protein [Candidatus Limnocylindrales bacterium]|nr:nuclear transport factor 2 family protein [Candidatus Limnocylindrales bacterium]